MKLTHRAALLFSLLAFGLPAQAQNAAPTALAPSTSQTTSASKPADDAGIQLAKLPAPAQPLASATEVSLRYAAAPAVSHRTLGRWSYEVEHLARAKACNGGAWLVDTQGVVEIYQVDCGKDNHLAATCEAGACELLD